MRAIYKLLILPFMFFCTLAAAQRGIDGNRTISAAGTIVNEYTTLTANASAGNTSITVAASGLNANGRFGAGNTLAAGDLIMIIQMQGATINGSSFEFPAGSGTFYGIPNDNTWGNITNYNNSGNYEFAQVNSVPNATTITLDCALQKNYTAAGKVQVIRVPRYNSLVINAPGTLTGQAWNGSAGGVVSVEVQTNTQINTANGVNVTAIGFRGGALSANNSAYGGGQHAMPNYQEGAEKGEGIAGYQADYNIYGGRYARGKAANAGGGGNCHNAGGGGGSNAGSLTGWNGNGNPDASVAGWATAWNLEFPGFAGGSSPGGGRGGYSFSSSNQNATTLGPYTGTANAWNGDYRRNNGGLGGINLDYSTGKLFLGGGGGAGDRDNSAAGAGGVGGGLFYLMNYGTVSGSGSINANGGTGGTSGIDGAGGAGGGGTVIINSVGAISGITVNANGGTGGNQDVLFGTLEAEGPGGGGGGGYIAISNGVIAMNANGGANGTTDSGSLSEFPPNGATRGGAGLTNQTIIHDTISVAGVTICSGNTATLTASIFGTIPATINWYAAQTGGAPLASGSSFTTPVLTSTTTYYVGFCPGTYRKAVTVTVTPGPNPTITAQPPLCVSGSSVNLSAATGGGSWSGTGITNAALGTFNPGTAGAGSHVITYTIGGGCTASDTITILVNPNADATITAVSAVCTNTPAFNFTAAQAGGTWSGTGITNAASGTFNPASAGAGTFTITYTISGSCGNTDTESITVNPLANATINPQAPLCITAASLNLSAAQTGGTWTGPGITNASLGTFNPATAGAGSHIITYTIGGACGNSDTASITVIPQPNATITTVAPVCAGSAAFSMGAATAGGTWSGTGITNATAGTFDPSTAGIGSHIITYTLGGSCPNSDTAMVTVSPNADATITAVAPVCNSTAAFNLSAVTVGGSWTGTGITNAVAGTFTPSSAGPGTHTVTYTISGACGDIDTALITVNPDANATINPVSSLCVSASAITLTAATAGGTWSGDGITSASSGTFDPASAGIGSHLITYTISGSCGNTDTLFVNVNASSDATITPSVSVCVGASAFNLSAVTAGGTWSGPGIISASLGTFDPATAGTGAHIITYSITGTCGATDTAVVTVNPLSDVTIASQPPLCVNAGSVSLAALTSGGTWTGAGITNPSAGTFDPAAAGAGIHIITYTVSGSCGNTDTVSITVTSPANAAITAVPAVCVNSASFNMNAATAGGTWSGPGISSASSGTFDPALAGAGTHIVTYMITGSCGDTATQSITVNALPVPGITADITSGCSPVCVQFTELVSNTCTSVTYDFGDGNTSSASSPLNCYSIAGSYNVTITCTDANGCTGTSSIPGMINVFSLPVAGFTMSPTGVLEPNTLVSFNDISSNSVGSAWNFGDTASGINNFSVLPSPSHTFAAEGEYCIRLIAVSDEGCIDTTVNCITFADDAAYTVPNVFTPNGDNNNDIFSFRAEGISTLNCTVYDRWGSLISEWNTVQGGWDGRTSSGSMASDGVYFYIMKATAVNGKKIEEQGFVQLLKNN